MAHTINGAALTTYGATLLTKNIASHEVIQINDWLDGAYQPVVMRTEQRIKKIVVSYLIEGTTAAITEGYFAAMMLAMRAVELKFDDWTKYFDCIFDGSVTPNKLNSCAYLVEIPLKCYKTHLAEVTETANGVSSKSITSTGSVSSECQITVTPSTGIATYTITGLTAAPIVLSNLASGKAHVVDGYLYRYLKDGASDIANYGGYAWPRLPAGTTIVTFSSTSANVTIKYYPNFN